MPGWPAPWGHRKATAASPGPAVRLCPVGPGSRRVSVGSAEPQRPRPTPGAPLPARAARKRGGRGRSGSQENHRLPRGRTPHSEDLDAPHAEDAIANLPEAAMGGVGGGLKKASQRWNLMRMLKGRGHMEAQRCQGDLGDRRRGDRARAGRAGPYAATELTLVPCHPPGTRGSL